MKESGKAAAKAEGLTFLRSEKGFAVFIAGSGSYSFKSRTRPIEAEVKVGLRERLCIYL